MKKKILIVVVLIVMLFSITVNAYAVSLNDIEYVQKIVDIANAKINELVLDAQMEAIDHPNQVDTIISELIIETNEIAAETIDEAEEFEIIVICEYYYVTIGTKNVLIDPLVIGGW